MSLSNYHLTQIGRLARLTKTDITDRHLEILEYTFRYYEKNKVGPLYLNLKKHLGLDRQELDRLFPHGLNSLYTWVGIPIQTTDETCKPPAVLEVPDFREVYLDHNATTYIRHEIAQLLHDYHEGRLGYANPSSGTIPGQKAFELLEQSREDLAEVLHCGSEDLTFLSCGTEGNNTVIKSLALASLLEQEGRRKPHLVTSALEHSSVLEPHQWLETLGCRVTYVQPDSLGIIHPEKVEQALCPDTILVSIMAVNNEIGTINPLKEIGEVCRNQGKPLLVDAVQALGKIPLTPREWGVTFMTFSGHKIYGPKGVGALYKAPGFILPPLLQGGGQERGLRSGTENVGHILALAKAAQLAEMEREREQARILGLRNYFWEALKTIEPELRINGSLEHRLAGNLSVAFPGVDTGSMVLSLNNIGVYVSAGSACSSGKIKTSHVLKAIGADTENFGTIRFSLGLRTTKEGLDYVLKYLPEILRQIKN